MRRHFESFSPYSKAGAGKPSAPLRQGTHTSATSPIAISDFRGLTGTFRTGAALASSALSSAALSVSN